LVHPEDRAAAIALNDQTFETGQPVEGEWRVIWPDGSTHWIFGRFQAIKDASGQPLRMRGVNIDITERRKREEEFRRLNRTLQALGHSSQALTRAKEEVTYLQDVCKIVVEDCGHALVWIGYAEDDADRSVRPVSWSGFEEGYLETLKITWADTERGRGPTGTAIRTGKPAFCRNMLTDELFAPWRQEALNRGYASSLALPLRMSGREQPFGALTMYFPDADPFTEDEVRLLTELADDLAQGISTIRLRAERKRAEGVLQATLRRFYAILSKMYAAVLLVTDEGRVEFANQSVCDSFGLEDAPADLEGLTSSEMMEKIKNSYLRPAEAAARIREIVDRGQPVKGEELLMQGGRTSLRDFVPLNVDGKSYGRLWIHSDITEHKRAEEALRESEKRYRNLFNTMVEGFCIVEMIFDAEGKPADYRFLEVNAAFENQTGLHEARGKRMRDLAPAHEAHWFETYGKIALTGEPAHFVNEAKALNRWFEVYAYRVGEPEERHVAIIFNDISEQKRIEAALRTSEKRYRNLFSTMAEGFCIIEMIFDAEGRPADYRFLEVNAAFEKQTGLHDVQGKRIRDLVPSNEAYWFELYGKIALTGEPAHFVNETQGLNRWFEVHAYRVGEPEERHVAIVFNDISEQKRIEQTLRESERQFRELAEGIPQLAWMANPDGWIYWYNQRWYDYTGTTIEKMEGWGWQSVHDPNELPNVMERWQASIATGAPFEMTFPLRGADGVFRPFLTRGFPLRDAAGRVMRWFGTNTDVNDLKQAEEALRVSKEALFESHMELEQRIAERTQELTLSLAAVQSEMIVRKQTEEQLRDLSARLLRAQDEERSRIARDLHDSTGQLLVALKMSLTQLEHLVARVPKADELCNDVASLADQALQEVRTMSHLLHPPLLDELGFSSAAESYIQGFTKRSGIKTTLNLSAATKLTKTAELTLFRVLQESLTNVLRHSGSSSVEVRLDTEGEDCVLMIRDFGKGLSREALTTFNQTGAGVGVGLGGMKQRMRDLGGQLRVESDERGTTVVASLPKKLASATMVVTPDSSHKRKSTN
jgi:PAS domain S-box-containing protein